MVKITRKNTFHHIFSEVYCQAWPCDKEQIAELIEKHKFTVIKLKMQKPKKVINISLLILLMRHVDSSNNKTEDKANSLIVQEFFGFEKEVEDFFASEKEIMNFTNINQSLSNNSTLVLEPGIMAERDYDFYEDDLDNDSDIATAESAEVAVIAGIYPHHRDSANRRNDNDYEYEYQVEERGYEHSSEGYSDHGGSYGGGYDAGYKVQPKKPGPYGYATPNFKCEKTSETLYVTKTEMTYDKKCYNVYKVQCTDGYDEGKVGR